jgi:hypothetical protein
LRQTAICTGKPRKHGFAEKRLRYSQDSDPTCRSGIACTWMKNKNNTRKSDLWFRPEEELLKLEFIE